MVWDLDSCLALASLATRRAREAGALNVLTVELNVLTQQTCLAGDLDAAAALVDEAAAVTEATGSQVAPFGAILYRGMRGREAEALALFDVSVRRATELGQGVTVQHARWSASVLFNGLGRHDEAFEAGRAACEDIPQLFVSTRAAPELLEAAVKTGRNDIARRTLDHVVDATQAAGTVHARGVEARCRAMLAGVDAGAHHDEAVEILSTTTARPELARAHLSYGEWLVSRHRDEHAKQQLLAAHGLFAACRMEAFEERARLALAGTGVRVRGRRTGALDGLTPQEAEIARLAGGGLSNPEIGAKLFVSPRTVEWHLHKVFGKLGVASRGELAALVGAGPST
jgi:DNA-binding CsgD family transcriptional regulator